MMMLLQYLEMVQDVSMQGMKTPLLFIKGKSSVEFIRLQSIKIQKGGS